MLNYAFLKLDFIENKLEKSSLNEDQLFWANMIYSQNFNFKLHEEDEIEDFESLESFFIKEIEKLEKKDEFISIFKQIKEEFLNVKTI